VSLIEILPFVYPSIHVCMHKGNYFSWKVGTKGVNREP